MLRLLLVLALATPALAQLRATVDPRVELLSITFRLAGNPEYAQGRLPAYLDDLDDHFAPHADHELIRFARDLRAARGVSYDAVMSMAVHLDVDDGALVPRRPLDEAPALDRRWRRDDAARFVELLNAFAEDTGFWTFYAEHQPLYDLAAERMNERLAHGFDQPWFARYFGTDPAGSFELIIAPVNGGQAYGPKYVEPDGTEHVYAILGVWETDAAGDPRFIEGVALTIVHEFCHSFANPQVDRHEAELAPAGKAIYALVADRMRRQAYTNWKTMLCESLVRAATCRYVLEHDGPDAAQRHIEYEIGRGFLWTRDLAALLAEYEADRERYPTFDEFMPRVVAFFDDQAPIVRERIERADAARPRVVRTIPPDGAKDVDPALTTISATFDRAMSASWAFVRSPELGRDGYPETTGDPALSDDRRTITLPVRLRPGTTYELWLNSAAYLGFRSADGAPLKPYRLRFTTADE